MLEKTFGLGQINKARDNYCYLSSAVLLAGISVLTLGSPTIPMVIAVTSVAGGIGYIGLKQIQKLNNTEKSLQELKASLAW